MQNGKKMGIRDQDEKNGETRCKTKKKWGDEMRDEKKMRHETEKKWGDKTRDKKKGR